MFFFFVGGVEQQVGRVVKERAGRCIRCGSYADMVECEKVLKLFFVPVWRWPSKDPAFYCNNCSLLFPHSFPLPGGGGDGGGDVIDNSSAVSSLRCRSCARAVDPEFRFCPFCGSAL